MSKFRPTKMLRKKCVHDSTNVQAMHKKVFILIETMQWRFIQWCNLMHSSITGTNIGQRLKSKYPLITCSLLIFNLICHLFVKQVGEGGCYSLNLLSVSHSVSTWVFRLFCYGWECYCRKCVKEIASNSYGYFLSELIKVLCVAKSRLSYHPCV